MPKVAQLVSMELTCGLMLGPLLLIFMLGPQVIPEWNLRGDCFLVTILQTVGEAARRTRTGVKKLAFSS